MTKYETTDWMIIIERCPRCVHLIDVIYRDFEKMTIPPTCNDCKKDHIQFQITLTKRKSGQIRTLLMEKDKIIGQLEQQLFNMNQN